MSWRNAPVSGTLLGGGVFLRPIQIKAARLHRQFPVAQLAVLEAVDGGDLVHVPCDENLIGRLEVPDGHGLLHHLDAVILEQPDDALPGQAVEETTVGNWR